MDNNSSNHGLKDWGIFSQLPMNIQLRLQRQLKVIYLQPGEQLNDIEDLPPGIFYIQKGTIRLLSLDQRKELFTLEKYFTGQIVGIEQLLRGTTGQAIAASTQVKGLLLPTNNFLELTKEIPNLLESFSQLKSHELFAVTAIREDLQLPTTSELLKWAKEECTKKIEIKLLNPGDQEITDSSQNWIVSSSNIQNYPPGTLLIGPIKIHVVGKLPGRLIPAPNKWPSINTTFEISSSSNENSRKEEKLANYKKRQLRLESLEDWYGRLRDDGSFPQHNGQGQIEEPLACIRMVARYFDLPFRRDVIKQVLQNQLERSNNKIISLEQLAATFNLLGVRSSPLEPLQKELIKRIPLPSITVLDNHPCLLWETKRSQLLVGDPVNGQKWIEIEDLFQKLEGKPLPILYLERNANSPKARLGISWFLPSIQKYRSSLLQVVLASFFVQLLALFNPLLIQQIIDAVINQGNLSSLNVLGTLLVAMALAQALLGALRTYLFSDTTNRIDISLGATIIHHLLRLPLEYFARRPVGEVSSRIGELENIRDFLTGTALTVLLDAIFSVIYIAVMLFYSIKLTFWALAVVPLFVALTIGVSPIIRKQLRERAEANARVQSHLVETLSGMETVKGQGMELPSEWRWEKFYGGQIQAGFRNTITSTAAGSTSQLLQQISGLLVIWMGAMLVLEGKMSIGQLIAFRILSGYVTSPLLRLATLWQNFQETALSLERLSDIVDHQEEIEITGQNLPPMPAIKGSISYEGVNFRFSRNGPLQLLNVGFKIPAGHFIGIVGSSGSGKSTLLKLLTRLFDPMEGTIKIDDYDISKVDLYSLRTQIGVVPQDSLLFDGSVQENIALTRPEANFEEICYAAKVACAHEFIQAFSSGYNTSVGERGSGLSGGQRQRIAIARMVLKQPKLLVLDEATSALDSNTEKQLIANLMKVYKNTTVLFVSHRLNTLRNSDQILVMHQGALEEQGSHQELMELKGRYSTLYKQQESRQ